MILGHSERRINYSEDNNLIKQKIILAFKNNIIPILCCGENLEDFSKKNQPGRKPSENIIEVKAEEIK